MVPLEPVTPAALRLGANRTIKARRCAKLQSCPQLRFDIPAKVLYRVDADAIVKHCLDEGVLAQLAQPFDW